MPVCIRNMWMENNSRENKGLKLGQGRMESARFIGYQERSLGADSEESTAWSASGRVS